MITRSEARRPIGHRLVPVTAGLALCLVGALSAPRTAAGAGGDEARATADPAPEAETETETETESEPAVSFRDELTVRARPLGQIDLRSREAERRALPLIEVSAPDRLGRFSDQDAAAAAQRLPGITVIREQGDARLVLVRGFLPSFNSATLDGERIPAGEADERAVALDLVPTALLESIVVHKTPTPDMDGDAIGGTVELVTRRPPAGRRAAASAGWGHDDGSDGERTLGTASLGRYLEGPRLGLSLSLSRRRADRGVDSVEIERDGEGEVEERRLQDHDVRRDYRGAGGTLEWSPRPGSEIRLRGLWSEFEDVERRRALVERFDEGEAIPVRELKDRPETQELASLAFDGSETFGGWRLAYRASWARAEEEDPDRLDSIFVRQGEDFVLEGFRTEEDRGAAEDLVLALDLEADRGGRRWQWGAKARRKDLRRDETLRIFEPADDAEIRLASVADPGWRPADPFFGGEFAGLFPDPELARRLFGALALDAETDAEEDAGDFVAEEEVTAAYGLVELDLGPRTSLLGGLRWEGTETSYRGFEVEIPEDGDPQTVPARGGGSYDELLPSLVLRRSLGEGDTGLSTLRAGFSRTFSRPDLEDLAPSRLVIFEDREIVVGHPELRPASAWNLDLQWQRALAARSSLSVALYAKELSDVIVETRTAGNREADGPASFTRVRPENVGDATVVGLELSLRHRFRSLPRPFDRLGLLANLTRADADADLAGRPPGMALPGQAKVSGSVVLSWEGDRLSARLLYSYRDEIVEELGETPDLDVHLEAHGQLDLSWQVRVARRWSLFGEAFNLTEEPTSRFEGSAERLLSEERIGWWATVGLRFDL